MQILIATVAAFLCGFVVGYICGDVSRQITHAENRFLKEELRDAEDRLKQKK